MHHIYQIPKYAPDMFPIKIDGPSSSGGESMQQGLECERRSNEATNKTQPQLGISGSNWRPTHACMLEHH
jgi:hypothetical protein